MKFLYKYKKQIIPIAFCSVACVVAPISLMGANQPNSLATVTNYFEQSVQNLDINPDQNVLSTRANSSDESKATGIKVGKDVVDVTKIDDAYPYLIDYVNDKYRAEKCELIRNYINTHHEEIFYNPPLFWDPSLTNVEIVAQADWSILARVRYYGYDESGQLSKGCKANFRLWFKNPASDQIFFALKNLVNSLSDKWPSEWSNSFQDLFFDKIKVHTLSVVRNNPNSFPKTLLDRLNDPTTQNAVYFIDKSKVTLGSDFLEIKSQAISLNSGIALNYEGTEKVLKIYVSSDIKAQPVKEKTFLEKNGWITIVLPSIIGCAILVGVIIIIIKYLMKKPPVDPDWGFY